jgi:hypothetical protein
MGNQKKDKTFKTMKEYFDYYSNDTDVQVSEGSKYYRIGQEIANMACEKVLDNINVNQGLTSAIPSCDQGIENHNVQTKEK